MNHINTAVQANTRFKKAVALYSTLIALIRQWRANRNTRKQLVSLPDFMLKDIGISRSEAEQEYQKPFWKL